MNTDDILMYKIFQLIFKENKAKYIYLGLPENFMLINNDEIDCN